MLPGRIKFRVTGTRYYLESNDHCVEGDGDTLELKADHYLYSAITLFSAVPKKYKGVKLSSKNCEDAAFVKLQLLSGKFCRDD